MGRDEGGASRGERVPLPAVTSSPGPAEEEEEEGKRNREMERQGDQGKDQADRGQSAARAAPPEGRKCGSTEANTEGMRRGALRRGKHGTEPKNQSTTRNQRVGEPNRDHDSRVEATVSSRSTSRHHASRPLLLLVLIPNFRPSALPAAPQAPSLSLFVLLVRERESSGCRAHWTVRRSCLGRPTGCGARAGTAGSRRSRRR